jgi:hypothetical protein
MQAVQMKKRCFGFSPRQIKIYLQRYETPACPNRILKGLRQLAGTPPVVIIRAQVECDGRKACAKAENALSNISRNVQMGIR